ncbi:hypothetical protein B0H21DRAFT_845002 [Amylocystis lapponica]|nr:hypothetical protein B0H21DRAFT_845002 [Amylocystis lapponica]
MADPTTCIDPDKPGEGCYNVFPSKESIGLCSKCKLVSEAEPGSGASIEKESWPQCKDCGVCARRMTGSRCGRCQVAFDAKNGIVDETVRMAQQKRTEAFNHRLHHGPPKIPTQAQENPLAKGVMHSQIALTTGSVQHAKQLASGSSNAAQGRNFVVNIQPRLRSKIDAFLGPNTFQYNEATTMDEIIDANLVAWNAKWEKKHSRSLAREDTDLRWHSNRNIIVGTEHLTLGEFYDTHRRTGVSEAYFEKLPKHVPIFKNTKHPVLALELWIDVDSFYDRTEGAMETSFTSTAKDGKGKKRGLSSAQDDHQIKRIRAGGNTMMLQSTYQHRSSFQPIPDKVSTVQLLLGICKTAVTTGEVDISWPKSAETELLTATLSDKHFAKGATKFVYKLAFKTRPDLHVAKRFFNVGSPDEETVNPAANYNNLYADLCRLKVGQWFLDKFYERARSLGQEVADNFEFVDALIAKEVVDAEHEPSPASGFESHEVGLDVNDHSEGGVFWLIEPRRTIHVDRYSGTMVQQRGRGKQQQTMNAFAHFVYGWSDGKVVMADLQCVLRDKRNGNVLFDVMTHTPEGNSGVGDHASEGIKAFEQQHICQDICRVLKLDVELPIKHVALPPEGQSGNVDDDDDDLYGDNKTPFNGWRNSIPDLPGIRAEDLTTLHSLSKHCNILSFADCHLDRPLNQLQDDMTVVAPAADSESEQGYTHLRAAPTLERTPHWNSAFYDRDQVIADELVRSSTREVAGLSPVPIAVDVHACAAGARAYAARKTSASHNGTRPLHHGTGSQSPPAPAQAPATSLSPGPTAPEAEPPSQASPPAQHAPTIVPAVVPAAVANVGTSSAPPGAILQQGLETFDASTFDPSSPASWVALGNAWSVTHRYIPSQEELMQFTLSGGLMGLLPIASQFDAQQMDVW